VSSLSTSAISFCLFLDLLDSLHRTFKLAAKVVFAQGPLITLDIPHGPFPLAIEGRIRSGTCQIQHTVLIEQVLDFKIVENVIAIALDYQWRNNS